MAPEAKSADLLYVTAKTGDVLVYGYPGGKPVGTLTGFGDPRGACVDTAGNVFIADAGADDVVEFAHGGTQPIAALDTSGPPLGCSVDSVTGSLAASGGVSGVAVTVFRKTQRGWSTPNRYVDDAMSVPGFCGYDGNGNLFVDGVAAKSGTFALALLRPRARKLTPVAVHQTIAAPGQVQWDGAALAIGDAKASPAVAYRFSVGRNAVKEIGAVTLDGSGPMHQFWIQGGTLIGPDPRHGSVKFWNYPAGGAPSQTIMSSNAFGAVVSPAQ
jgi:hypothetical protein